MCTDAELVVLDAYAQGFVDDIRRNVIKWGMGMFLSERQEFFLMTIASKSLRTWQAQQRRKRSA